MENYFDYQKWLCLKRSSEDEGTKHLIALYEECLGSLDTAIEETVFYKSYLSYFNESVDVDLPLFDDYYFDFDLLMKLIFASLSSSWELTIPVIEGQRITKSRLNIAVSFGLFSVRRILSELDPFQIFRLFEIYISEQINFAKLEYKENLCSPEFKNNSESIKFEKKKRLDKFQAVIKSRNSHKELLEYLLLMGFKS